MKKLLALLALILLGTIGWQVGESMSSDAIALGVGVLFGAMSGVPAVMMVLAAHRREQAHDGRPVPQATAKAAPVVHNHYYYDTRQVHVHGQPQRHTMRVPQKQLPSRQIVQ